LGLISDDGTPTDTLRALVKKNELERKELLRQIFESSYKELFTIDLTSATPSQLTERMTECYGVTGSTLGKAVRFFLTGAIEVGIPLSSYLTTAKGSNGVRRRIARKQRVTSTPPPPPPLTAQANSAGTTSKTIRLETAEMTLTLIVPGNYGALTSSDRKFVFDLMDRLDEYEAKAAPPAVPSSTSQIDEEGEEG